MQMLQIASLASSVVGIGVTAATTAVILKRLSAIDETIKRIESSVVSLPGQWREMDLRNKLGILKTSIERVQEAEIRRDFDSVLRGEEERLHLLFGELHAGICTVVIQERVNADLLRSLLAGLSLCSGVQLKALIWLNMKEAAERRAVKQWEKQQDLAFLMPRHVMVRRLDGSSEQAEIISKDCSEIRLRMASQPDLARTLISEQIDGREFIARIQNEQAAPILILPKV